MESSRLKQALGYPKFRGEVPRVLVFEADYLMINDVISGARELGWSVSTISTQTKGVAKEQFVRDLLTKILSTRPDFLLTINHFGFDEEGILASLLDNFQIPVASWFVDHPLPILGGAEANAVSSVQTFCFERTALPWLMSRGFEEPRFLPTASNRLNFHPERVDLERAKTLGSPLAFVGNSWWTKAIVEPPKMMRRAAKKLLQRTAVNRRHLDENFDERLNEVLRGLPGDRSQYRAAGVAFAMASMETRKRFARALLPLGLRIHGDPYWKKLVPGIDLKPGLDPVLDLPPLFSGTAINVNVTAEQMPTALNLRVWDVPGVEGFLITDAQEDALEFFEEDVDMVLYRDLDEAKDKVKFYLDHPAKRQSIAKKGFERVESLHRMTHRLQDMAAAMKARFG